MLRCLIDYVRLTDVAEVPCSLEVVQPSLLPKGDADISGSLIEQARWIMALVSSPPKF